MTKITPISDIDPKLPGILKTSNGGTGDAPPSMNIADPNDCGPVVKFAACDAIKTIPSTSIRRPTGRPFPSRQMTGDNSTLSLLEINDIKHFKTVGINKQLIALQDEMDRLDQSYKSMIELRNNTCPHLYTTEEYDDDFNHPRRYKSCNICKMNCWNGGWM